MKRVNKLKGICSTVVLLMVSTTVTADKQISMPPPPSYDIKGFSGLECQSYYGTQISDLRYYSYGIYNINGTYNRSVSCPVMRDDDRNTDGTYAFYVYVYNAGGTLTCTLYSYNAYSTLAQSVSASKTTTGDGYLNLDNLFSYSGGKYNLVCSLPPYSRLYGYRLYERENTDYGDMTDYNQ